MKQIDLRPVITETSLLNAKKNWFTFRSPVEFNKDSLREAISKMFKVEILDIKTMVVKGKTKRSARSRKVTHGSNWKKILVLLKEGQKIDAFDIGA